MEIMMAAHWTPSLAYLGGAMVLFSAVIGAVAAISPRAFEQLNRIADKGFSLDGLVALIERPIDAERYLKPHTRLLGISALVSALCVAQHLYPFV
jgi:hypothetical protein